MLRFFKKIERVSALVGILLFIICLIVWAIWHFLPGQTVKVTTQQIEEKNAKLGYTIDVQYPQVANLPFASGNTVNSSLKHIADLAITNFKSEVQTFTQINHHMAPSSLTIRYEVGSATSQVVSVAFTVSDFPASAAHPFTTVTVYNYSVVRHQEVTLGNLFNQKTNYLEALSQMAQKELQSQLAVTYDSFFSQGALPTKEHFSKFILTPTAIVFLFDPGTVAPYVAGVRKVIIPYTSLKAYFAAN